jgi:hypothetical protein
MVEQVWMQSYQNTLIAMLEASFDRPDDALAIFEPKIPKPTCTA